MIIAHGTPDDAERSEQGAPQHERHNATPELRGNTSRPVSKKYKIASTA